jgi:transcriptional regulator GlxA family with amidase domain
VSGGDIIRSIAVAQEIVAWLRRVEARRMASVCSGAYLLAEAGLLDGRRATTHWGSTDDFGRRYPKITLEVERIFIRDGKVWTSAGISAGIDLALALIPDEIFGPGDRNRSDAACGVPFGAAQDRGLRTRPRRCVTTSCALGDVIATR